MGSWQLVMRVPAFRPGLRFTCLLTCQTGALECSRGHLPCRFQGVLVCQRLQQAHPRGQNYLGGQDGGGTDYPYPQR